MKDFKNTNKKYREKAYVNKMLMEFKRKLLDEKTINILGYSLLNFDHYNLINLEKGSLDLRNSNSFTRR